MGLEFQVLVPPPVPPCNLVIPVPTQSSRICLYPEARAALPASLLSAYLVQHHLSYPSPQGFFTSNKTVCSAEASWCQPVSAITRCSFTVAPPDGNSTFIYLWLRQAIFFQRLFFLESVIFTLASNLWDIKAGSVAFGRLTDLWSFPSSSLHPPSVAPSPILASLCLCTPLN